MTHIGTEYILVCMKNSQLKRFLTKVPVAANDACWDWIPPANKQGYGQFWLGDGKMVLAHRVAYELEKGAIPKGLDVRHLCNRRSCVNPNHLTVGTRKENMADSPGAYKRGDTNPAAKLDWDKVEVIRTSTKSSYELSLLFGISSSLVRRVRRNLTWVR